jgi:hypothetical protein
MRIERCPNLEHLAIDGHALVDAHGIFRRHWITLIGHVVLDLRMGLNPVGPFHSSLNAHCDLESLHLQSPFSDLQADVPLIDHFQQGASTGSGSPSLPCLLESLRVPSRKSKRAHREKARKNMSNSRGEQVCRRVTSVRGFRV